MADFLLTNALAIATIVAILAGPFIGIWVSRRLDVGKEIRERKLEIFKTLMKTRATRLSPAHVEALNQIDLEFDEDDKNDKEVIEAWKLYLDHLAKFAPDDAWSRKSAELLVEMLQKMAKTLSFKFDKVHIMNSAYRPLIHVQIENEQLAILQGCRQILHHERTLPIYDATNEIIAALKQQVNDGKPPEDRAQ